MVQRRKGILHEELQLAEIHDDTHGVERFGRDRYLHPVVVPVEPLTVAPYPRKLWAALKESMTLAVT
jgi:hypothetical protein